MTISNTEINGARVSIYSNREATIEASEFINNNMESAYLGMKGSNNYYNVNGVVWSVFHSGCGTYPTSNGQKVSDFSAK